MKSKIIGSSFLWVAVMAIVLSSCKKEKIEGSGQIKTESRTAANFYIVEARGSFPVTIKYSNEYSVTVKGFENLLPKFETKVENGTLYLQYENGVNISNDNIEVEVTLPTLTGVTSRGSNNISVSGNFIGMDALSVSSYGSGDILIIDGNANNLNVILSGSGNLYAFGLGVQNAIVNSAGSGNAEVNVVKTLKATLSGSGNVFYKGSPTVEANISGSGKVIKK